MKRVLVLSLLLVLFNSCKEATNKNIDETLEDSTTKVEEPTKKQLVFKISFETTIPDDFTLYSKDVFLNNNKFMDIYVKHKLNMNETQKTITYEFPEGIVPDYNLSLLLGREHVKEVIINNITVSFGGKVIDIKPSELTKYFALNKYIDFNSEEGKLMTKKVKGKHNPVISLKKKFLTKLIN
ncbi:MAG: hypothetical protein KDD23_11875 [Winogradskyella sp.]|jgi:hypothetical protein|uniref:hypothetical protein n=1 Tax=Xanthomarina gelatinilytica TaxID=1137281 RepID=UPI001E03F4BF|nr:hypothetical protein [Winogradskyella sp.]